MRRWAFLVALVCLAPSWPTENQQDWYDTFMSCVNNFAPSCVCTNVDWTTAGLDLTDIAATCTDSQVVGGDSAGTGLECQADLTCNDSGVTCLFAGSASEGGPATTALALEANGSNCGAGEFAQGVDAQGNAEGCAAGGTFTCSDLTGCTTPTFGDGSTSTVTIKADVSTGTDPTLAASSSGWQSNVDLDMSAKDVTSVNEVQGDDNVPLYFRSYEDLASGAVGFGFFMDDQMTSPGAGVTTVPVWIGDQALGGTSRSASTRCYSIECTQSSCLHTFDSCSNAVGEFKFTGGTQTRVLLEQTGGSNDMDIATGSQNGAVQTETNSLYLGVGGVGATYCSTNAKCIAFTNTFGTYYFLPYDADTIPITLGAASNAFKDLILTGIVRADSSDVIGVQVDDASYTVGSLGSLVAPVDTVSGSPTDTEFGNKDGALAVNSADDRLYYRSGGSWVQPPTVYVLRAGTYNTNPGDAVTTYAALSRTPNLYRNTASTLAGVAMTCTSLTVVINNVTQAPTAETTTVVLEKNGVDTDLTCSIDTTTTATTCTDTGSATFAATDLWDFQFSCSGTDCPVNGVLGTNISAAVTCEVFP